MSESSQILGNIFIIALLVLSIVLHEIAHGYAALLFGDHTAKNHGRLTLNPIPHIDLKSTIIIPVVAYLLSGGSFIIGGAKPVPVNPYYFRRPVLGDVCVSVAGVAVNFILAVVMILLLNIVILVFGGSFRELAVFVLLKGAILNILLGMFNLIPIPPLDGSHLFKYLLPDELRAGYEKLGRSGVGFIILIVLINVPAVWSVFSSVMALFRDFLLRTLIVL